MKFRLRDKFLIPPTIILGVYFLIRLINQSKLIFTFPLDLTNDITSYMAQLYFLFECGFHKFCPHWYNGFITFVNYAPGWAFFTAPLYFLFKNLQLSTYLSMIFIYILAFIFLFYFGKSQRLSLTKIILFFLLLFANPITIGNFIRLGRLPSLLAWTLFIALAGLIFYYKDKKIDKKFLLIPFLFSFILITHQSEAILSSILFLSLFLIKKNKERLYILATFLAGIILSSFWTIPFLLEFFKSNSSSSSGWIFSLKLFDFSGQWFWTNIAAFIVPAILFITAYFYFRTKLWKKKEIYFFLPLLILSALLLLRITPSLPILNRIYPDEYMFFMLFFSAFFMLKSKYNKILQVLLIMGLILISIVGVSVSLYHTPWFVEYTSFEDNIISLIPEISEKFLVLGCNSKTFFNYPFYAFSTIYYNKSTPSGWAHAELNKEKLLDLKIKPNEIFISKNCIQFNEHMKKIQTEIVITSNKSCNFFKKCNLDKISEKGGICVYSL